MCLNPITLWHVVQLQTPLKPQYRVNKLKDDNTLKFQFSKVKQVNDKRISEIGYCWERALSRELMAAREEEILIAEN